MISQVRRQQLHVIAANVLSRYGGQIRYGTSRFSPKWLEQYCPITLRRRLRRRRSLSRFLEAIGFLPTLYSVIAYFDAEANVFAVYGKEHVAAMNEAVREISDAIGVEVTLIKRGALITI